jgi:hypothetical protein
MKFNEYSINRVLNFKKPLKTDDINEYMYMFDESSRISVSVQYDGFQFTMANTSVNIPKKYLNFRHKWNKVFGWLLHLDETYIDYGTVVSNKNIILNEYATQNNPNGIIVDELYKEWENRLKNYIPKGYTIYGTIIGKNIDCLGMFDYKCQSVYGKLMIYRVTKDTYHGYRVLTPAEIVEFIDGLQISSKALNDTLYLNLEPYRVLFHGKIKNLPTYKESKNREEFEKNFAKALCDIGHLNEREPLCDNDVQRKGVVVRLLGANDCVDYKFSCLNHDTCKS